MTKAVFKYTFRVETLELDLPKGAQVLSVHEQHGQACMWVLVDPTQTHMKRRTFKLVATGEPIPDADNLKFIGTVMLMEGSIVLHAFEVQK